MIQSVSQAVGRSVSPSHIYMYKQSVLELHIEGERCGLGEAKGKGGRMRYVVLYRLLYLAQTFPFKLFINIIFYSSRERESKRNWKK